MKRMILVPAKVDEEVVHLGTEMLGILDADERQEPER